MPLKERCIGMRMRHGYFHHRKQNLHGHLLDFIYVLDLLDMRAHMRVCVYASMYACIFLFLFFFKCFCYCLIMLSREVFEYPPFHWPGNFQCLSIQRQRWERFPWYWCEECSSFCDNSICIFVATLLLHVKLVCLAADRTLLHWWYWGTNFLFGELLILKHWNKCLLYLMNSDWKFHETVILSLLFGNGTIFERITDIKI